MKNTCNAGIESKGFCFYKRTNGIKRHQPQWIYWAGPSLLTAPKRCVSDDQGLIELLTQNIDYFKSKPLELPKITILVDRGYHPEKLRISLEQIYPQIMSKLQFELSAKPSKAQKEAKGQSGFVPIAARWVIERSNAWVERCKSLVKNFDRTLDRANAKLKLCSIGLLLKRLAAPATP